MNDLKKDHQTPILRTFLLIFIAVFWMVALNSCGIKTRIRKMMGIKQTIKVFVSQAVNQNSAIAMDLVIVLDKQLMDRLREMPSKEWFEKREQIKRDYLVGVGIDTLEREWAPGQTVPDIKLKLKPKAKGALIFAKYSMPGAHRFVIDPFKSVAIHLNENNFEVKPIK